jgi:DNA-binding NarL/FixJ family response regulator
MTIEGSAPSETMAEGPEFPPPRRMERLDSSETGEDRLTRRELEVLGLMAGGTGTDAIGLHLGITRVTVRNHAQRILKKLRAHSRLEAVATARRRGLLRGSEPAGFDLMQLHP